MAKYASKGIYKIMKMVTFHCQKLSKKRVSVLSQHGIHSPTISSCTCPRALSLQEYTVDSR